MSVGGRVQWKESAEEHGYRPTGTDGPAPLRVENARGVAEAEEQDLKRAVAERLAAHRRRRNDVLEAEAKSEAEARNRAAAARSASRHGAAKVREAVAERYRQTQSYREFLAVEAERALAQAQADAERAQAEAEMAARAAAAVAEASHSLLAELDQWNAAQEVRPSEVIPVRQQTPVANPAGNRIAFAMDASPIADSAEPRGELAHALADIALGACELISEPPLDPSAPALTVRLFEQNERPSVEAKAASRTHSHRRPAQTTDEPRFDFVGQDSEALEELDELEQEIAFRRAPDFSEHSLETVPIPGNIIEFPRQLIAPRKARPRLAEGPLREEAQPEPQLRIFEVEPEQISVEPAPAPQTAAPEWQSLLLESVPLPRETMPVESQAHFTFQPQPASVARRLFAAFVDGVCVLAGFGLFAAAAIEMAGPALHELRKPVLAGSAGVVLLAFFLLYQTLFFSFADATPGMRAARIALCTFGDDNPSRKAMRRRTLATLLAACPLGIGLAWVWMDDDGLGWHDRISRMYQRAY